MSKFCEQVPHGSVDQYASMQEDEPQSGMDPETATLVLLSLRGRLSDEQYEKAKEILLASMKQSDSP